MFCEGILDLKSLKKVLAMQEPLNYKVW